MVRLLDIKTANEASREIKDIGADLESIPILSPKFEHIVIKIEKVNGPACNILKQEALSIGADCAIPRAAILGVQTPMEAIVVGNLKQINMLANKLKSQPFGLQEIGSEIEAIINKRNPFILRLRFHKLDLSHPLICGILNITPDSFYDGGKWLNPSCAVDRAHKLLEEGADLIDIGGESTRPGAEPLSAKDELHRVIPVLERLNLPIPISIDTYKSCVAKEALDAGCELVNDVSGLRYDSEMPKVIVDYDAGCVIMHMKGTPKTMQINPIYDNNDVIGEIIQFLSESIEIAKKSGINDDSLLIDPGIGFGKRNPEDNLLILRKLSEFKTLRKPILVGVSRKSFIGKVLDVPLDDRLEGSLAASVIAVMNGANIIRTHDVLATKRAVKMADAILGCEC
ncbi:MAG: dihydropteroate synthase [bacterium]|nr:dihydropteroate synthase [bacterium]